MIDINNTATLIASIRQTHPVTTFLQDRYFPTDLARDVFATDSVVVEYEEDGQKVAPFVTPRASGIVVNRNGYQMREFRPGRLALRRSLTIDDLSKRNFGEALYSELTPDQRELAVTTQDMIDLQNMLQRTKELMARDVILNNGLTMKEYNDDMELVREVEVAYGDDKNYIYTPSAKWTYTEDSGKQIYEDMHAMIKKLTSRGLPATDMVVSEDVAEVLVHNDYFLKLLDNRRAVIVNQNMTENPDGTNPIMIVNVYGHNLNVFMYDQQYTSYDGKTTENYIPKGTCFIGAPAAGHTVYGAVTQMENGKFVTIKNINVPKMIIDEANDARDIRIASRPLQIPFRKEPFVVAQKLI